MEAEKGLLSCLLLDQELLYLCKVQEKHLTIGLHKEILKAIRSMSKEWLDLVPSTVAEKSWVDLDYIYEVLGFSVTPTHRQTYWQTIQDNYNKQEIARKCRLVLSLCEHRESDTKEIMQKVNDLQNIETEYKTKTLFTWVFDTFEKLFTAKESIMLSDTTGYRGLDAILWGWRSWSVYILGARPSIGKSTMMLNFVLKSPIKCCILSTEMPAHEIHIRMMSIISKVESYKIERAKKEVEQVVSDAIIWFTQRDDCNIYDSFMFEDLESIIAKEASLGTKIVFVDYLQQIRSNQRQDSINNYIGKITGLFKSLAIKYGIAIVVLAQLNRQVWEGEPELTHLRDSGNIEQDADVVMFLHNNENEMLPDKIDLLIKKNRHWAKDRLTLNYQRLYFLIS